MDIEAYEAGRAFIIGEYKKKLKQSKEIYSDEELDLIRGDYNHVYYTEMKQYAAERDEKLAELKSVYDASITDAT